MGREADLNRARAEAEFERQTGPIRPFQATKECDKCGAPISGFGVDEAGAPKQTPGLVPEIVLCPGKNMLDSSNRIQCPLFGEHLHKRCPACKFVWNEHTKDHREDEA